MDRVGVGGGWGRVEVWSADASALQRIARGQLGQLGSEEARSGAMRWLAFGPHPLLHTTPSAGSLTTLPIPEWSF